MLNLDIVFYTVASISFKTVFFSEEIERKVNRFNRIYQLVQTSEAFSFDIKYFTRGTNFFQYYFCR